MSGVIVKIDESASHKLLLEQLAAIQPAEESAFKITVSEDGRTYTKVNISWIRDIFERILRFFGCGSRRPADDICCLKSFFERVFVDLSAKEELRKEYAPLVERAFSGLKTLYKTYHYKSSPEYQLKCNDILEALSVAYRKERSLNHLLGLQVRRIQVAELNHPADPFKEANIPLVRFADMEEATKCLLDKPGLTLEEVEKELGDKLVQEHVPMGWAIDLMYKHNMNYDMINRCATQCLGKKHSQEVNDPEKMVAFLQSLTIPIEAEWNGEIYAYGEFFQKALRDENNNNEAFQRDLIPSARELHLRQANQLQEEISKAYGQGSVVISNSYNRLRLIHVDRGGVNKKFNIVGKVLSDTAENREAAKNEKSYTGQFAFCIKNILGNADDVDTTFRRDNVVTAGLDAAKAKRLLLDCTTNMIDRDDVTLDVQRLSPQDLHHFTDSANGRTLSLNEWREELLKRLPTDAEHERRQLEVLSKVLQAEQELTVNIEGTQASVNTKALTKHSEILAQNDRKISMRRHADGSISIHFFIGATGVNVVDVGAEKALQETVMGQDRGKMGFGDDPNKADWQRGLMTREESINMRATATPGAESRLGNAAGSFNMRGSTVISLYFRKDVVPVPALDAFSQVVRYQKEELSSTARVHNCCIGSIGKSCGNKKILPNEISRGIEVQARLGDVIGLPVAYVAAKGVVDTIAPNRFQAIIDAGKKQSLSAEATVAELLKQFAATPLPAVRISTEYHRVIKQAWDASKKRSEELTPEERYLMSKLTAALLFRVSQG